MDYAAFKREMLAHHIRMASQPAFKAHAWHSANALAQKHPILFADLPEMLKQAMLERKDSEPAS